MRHRPSIIVLAAGVAVAALIASPLPASAAHTRLVRAAASGACPIGALKKAKKPVEITLWHSTVRANEETLTKLTSAFNASQSDVLVKLQNQVSYLETINKYKAALGGGNLPDLVQIEDTGLQTMIDSQSIVPAQACVKADHYSLNDYIPRVVDYFSVKGTLYPMPFNISNPVLYYNKQAFQKAGLDPNKAPTTLDEVKADAQKLVSSGATKSGFAVKLDPWYLEQWLAKAGKPYVNNSNGRKARATKVLFDNPAGREIATFLKDMVDKKLAINVGQPEGNIDNLLAIGSNSAGMTIDSSASLGTIVSVLGSGQFPNVTLGVGAMPGPTGKGGILVGGAALYIVKSNSPAREEAAWRFTKFLNEPQQQADWAAGTGYIPIRKSSTKLPVIQALWAKTPAFKVGYDQLVTPARNVATAGPVIGPYQLVRNAVVDAFSAMLTQGTSPKAALKSAQQKADAAISEYNSRVG